MHQIRARFDAETIRVYQAYSPAIGLAAVERQTLRVPGFKLARMSWIKPSFNWMMYRCGFGQKPDQEVVLAIDITRTGFEWALARAVQTRAARDGDAPAEVLVQWDPERDWRLEKLPVRSLQMGITGAALERYVDEWTVRITDISDAARSFAAAEVLADDHPSLAESVYPLPEALSAICAEAH
jgi:Domain of unknown function (DUF4291)